MANRTKRSSQFETALTAYSTHDPHGPGVSMGAMGLTSLGHGPEGWYAKTDSKVVETAFALGVGTVGIALAYRFIR